jgi:hypothetical protein
VQWVLCWQLLQAGSQLQHLQVSTGKSNRSSRSRMSALSALTITTTHRQGSGPC